MTITVVDEGRMQGAHVHSSEYDMPNDVASPVKAVLTPPAGLTDRGFSTGLWPTLLEGSMNLTSSLPGKSRPRLTSHLSRAGG